MSEARSAYDVWHPGDNPLPWTWETHEMSEGVASIVYDANGLRVQTDHLTEPGASDMVRRANCHDDLVVALSDLRKRFYAACVSGGTTREFADAACAKADMALARASPLTSDQDTGGEA